MKAAKINLKRLLMTGFVVYAAVTLINQQVTITKLTTIQKEKTEKVQSIQLENQKLQEMIKNSATDENIEKMAREQLGLVKPGERVYINQSEASSDPKDGDK